MAEERQQTREKVHRLEQELFELDEQIKATEGHRIQTKIRGLASSYYVFLGNYEMLVRALDYFGREEVFMELWREDNRIKLERFIDEVTRLLHNFLAGQSRSWITPASSTKICTKITDSRRSTRRR
jgi:1,4-alpha-glucan branching enzyme